MDQPGQEISVLVEGTVDFRYAGGRCRLTIGEPWFKRSDADSKVLLQGIVIPTNHADRDMHKSNEVRVDIKGAHDRSRNSMPLQMFLEKYAPYSDTEGRYHAGPLQAPTRAVTSWPRFITIEGGEGGGKSTSQAIMEIELRADGREVVVTREPGGTDLAEKIRILLLDARETSETLHPETELLLMFAARVQHVREVILPALNRGAWVLCSRFTDSSYAYQGAGRGLSMGMIRMLEEKTIGIEPGLTLFFDISIAEGRKRLRRRTDGPDRIEAEDDAFFNRVLSHYFDRIAAHPQRFAVIDASQTLPEVVASALNSLRGYRASLTCRT